MNAAKTTTMTPTPTRCRCLVFNPGLEVLDYRVPPGMAVEPGSVVLAPLGPRQILGIVWDEGRLPGADFPIAKLRPLLQLLPVPPLVAPLRRLIEWTADYYLSSLGSVARMALSSNAALQGGGMITEYRLTGAEPGQEPQKRLTSQRIQAIERLGGASDDPRTGDNRRRIGCSAARNGRRRTAGGGPCRQ